MKRRLTLPSSALLSGKEEEDAKKRKEKVGEREEEQREVEEGLASISSNHSTGFISKKSKYMDIIEKIAQGRERGELRRRLSEEGERRGRRRRRESRKGSSPSSPSPVFIFDILSAGDAGGTEEGGGGSREEAKGGAGPCPPRNEVQE